MFVIPVTAELGEVIVPVPATNVHAPIPMAGVFATSVVVEAHNV